MDDQNKNLIIATALSFVVILVWFVLFPPPDAETPVEGTTITETQTTEGTLATPSADVPVNAPAPATTTGTQTAPSAMEAAPRVAIETDRVSGRYRSWVAASMNWR